MNTSKRYSSEVWERAVRLVLGGRIVHEFLVGFDPHHDALGMDLRQKVYLFFKEALHNIVRHSGAEKVSIRVDFDGRDLTIVVKDDGVGFDLSIKRGSGLQLMRQRAEYFRGSFNVRSERGSGTELEFRVRLR